MNQIDKALERMLDEYHKPIDGDWQHGLAKGYEACIVILRTECADLLGKPVGDVRLNKDIPFGCYNCRMVVGLKGTVRCVYLHREVEYDNFETPRPTDCPIQWENSDAE